jgi:hypothetical protein
VDVNRQTQLGDGVLIEGEGATVPSKCHEIHGTAILNQARFIKMFGDSCVSWQSRIAEMLYPNCTGKRSAE